MSDSDTYLKTLDESGKPPASRIATAMQAKTIYEMLVRADTERARKRALVKGLVDGNPPYRQSDLRAAGQDYRCNINWRQSESYFNNAVGAFYDLFNEAPTYASVRLKNGTPEQIEQWSRIVTMHFDWLCRYEPCFDYHMQVSQDEMVLYGRGPLAFTDELDWRPMSLLDGQLKVPERTKSDTSLWELASVEVDYLPDELYKKIVNPKEAAMRGWNVERVRNAIIEACPDSQKGGLYRTWEYHQQQLKNGSLSYSYTSKMIRVAHLFFREFPKNDAYEGKVSHVIIVREKMEDVGDVFLFQKVERFDKWEHCIHPMYYDRGGGGFHHSVTGLGVKMYSSLEYLNRLRCNLADKAFTPKVMFRPTTEGEADDFSLQQMGDYSVLSGGFDVVQTPISGVMEEGITFDRYVASELSANLSQYRQNKTKESGNPATATQIEYEAQNEARLGKTQQNRYYIQMDSFYGEVYRRATLPEARDARAREFVARCAKSGVPPEALRDVEWVKASRVVGQGSEFLRQQALEKLFVSVTPMLPESGRSNLIDDVIASNVGQDKVDRYNPKKDQMTLPSEHIRLAAGRAATQ